MGEVTTAQPVNILGRPPQGPGDISTFEEALAYTRLDEEQIKSMAVHKDLRLRPPTLTSPNGSQQYYAI